eukprot:TRINITY_DN7689_c0_g1_i2.p1 TRINITY_DN7689_c0_g1~~TRINITY_DN7689_c0_g1_i2.p1  ORF type:complete len:265 (-),score=24.86 TRINITY_DN7689_c0_g1_i2:70-864(-)
MIAWRLQALHGTACWLTRRLWEWLCLPSLACQISDITTQLCLPTRHLLRLRAIQRANQERHLVLFTLLRHLDYASVPSQMAVPLRTNSDVAISVAKPATVAEYDTPLSMSSEKVDDHSSTEGSRRLLLGAVKRTSAATATQRRGSVVLARAAGRIQTRFRDSMEHMGTQCMKFASLLKTHNVRGAELARLWRGTCSPTTTFPSPVSNVGVGSAQYARLCNAISAAVAPFVGSTAAPLDWNPTDVCAAVLRSFKDSGVGSSPVIG